MFFYLFINNLNINFFSFFFFFFHLIFSILIFDLDFIILTLNEMTINCTSNNFYYCFVQRRQQRTVCIYNFSLNVF